MYFGFIYIKLVDVEYLNLGMGISVVDILMLLVYYGVDVVIIDEDYVIVIGVVIGMVVFE